MQEITLEVPQGVGDIFWIYQKFSPYCAQIHFNIQVLALDCPVQRRSLDWVKLFPKVGTVQLKLVSQAHYDATWNARYDLKQVLGQASRRGWARYACNQPLEQGIRLEDIDPGCPVAWDVPVRCDYCPIVFDPQAYVTLYVSGSSLKMATAWKPEQWAEFVQKVYGRFNLGHPLLLIGASYDAAATQQVQQLLQRAGLKTHTYIDSYPGNICYILSRSLFYIGYQSGLNVLADNFNTPQLMLYLPTLPKLLWSWPRLEHISSRLYQPFFFSQTPEQVAQQMVLPLRPELAPAKELAQTAAVSSGGKP